MENQAIAKDKIVVIELEQCYVNLIIIDEVVGRYIAGCVELAVT